VVRAHVRPDRDEGAGMTRLDWRHFDWSELGRGWPRDLRAAARLLTVFPLRSEVEPPPAEAAGIQTETGNGTLLRAAPLIGLVIGALGALLYWGAASLGLDPAFCAIAALALMAGASGALHEDGLADFADALGGRDPEARLAIMRDSRLGAFGALALIFSVGLRVTAIAEIADPGLVVFALLAAAAGSRGFMSLILLRLGPARADGLGAGLGEPSQETVATAFILALLAILIFLGPLAGLAALLIGVAATLGVAELARRRIGGYTGDIIGAAQQAAEIAILLAAAATF
jgi:adenosylcobinamide-GDP ribazoletransferase